MTLATIRVIGAAVAAALALDANAALSFKAVSNSKKLTFNGFVTVAGTEYQVAGNNGKAKNFAAVDDFVKLLGGYVESASGVYDINVDTGSYLFAAIPANLKTAAASKVAKLTGVKTAQEAVVADLDSQLALMAGWENGNVLQVEAKAKLTSQKAVVVADIAALAAEILVQQAIANS